MGGLVGGLLCALHLGDAAPCPAVAVAVAVQAPFGGKVLQALTQGQQRAIGGALAWTHIAKKTSARLSGRAAFARWFSM